ncbi:coiled-coil domain-containing protein 30 isoform X1 [Dromaius novaehollandiae]|uniref:coiled-coil domain-containing protein 30 isoform X1 n=1 Tax=Dromaius novaehollandiae TaxID=8790 RepID=UPI0031204C2D
MEAVAAAPAAEDVRRWLEAEGADPAAPAEQQLGLAWRLLRRSEAQLRAAARRLGDLERRRAEEMREVESYVGHVRNLTEEQDAITTEYERENEQLRLELTELQLQQEAQLKEVEEMLEQEGLSEIAHSNASEQIAYLLVERTTLLEKLEIADQKLNSHSYVNRLCAAQLQGEFDHIHQTLADELQQQCESMRCTKEAMNKSCRAELEREQALRAGVERDLDEATQRLQMAHEEIQRLTDELDAQRKEQSEKALQMPESWEEGVNEQRESDRTELQKAMEQNSRLDKEILALRARIQTLDLERKAFLDLVEQLKEEICEYQKSEKQGLPFPAPDETEEVAVCSLQTQGTKDEGRVEGDCVSGHAGLDQDNRYQDSEILHKRCREVIENIEGRNSQLLHKLQKLEQEHEDLVERNEELESILGDAQIQTKQEKEHFESEVEGLHQKITSLEMELLEVQKNKTGMSGEEQASTDGTQEMREMLESCQETIEKLGSQLGERRERRKQLASELELLREDLKAEKKELPDSKSELTSHSNDFQNLQRTSANRDFIKVSHEKLQKDNALLDTEVSELLQEHDQINKLKQKHEDLTTDEKTCEELMAKVVFLEEWIHNLRAEQEVLCSELLESNKKREELEKQLKESNEEKELLLEEIAQLKQDILAKWEQRDSMDEEALRMNQGMIHRENKFLLSQSSAGSLDGSIKQSLSEERFQQQEEKMRQLRQDLRRVQNLCSSAERELKYEREKNIDLQKQNLLLQQECTKVKAELKQARAKLLDTTETCTSLSAQWEKSQQKVKELEQELLKCSQADTLQSSLQEKLSQEKSKVCEAQKKISKLQQKLKESQHQLLLAEARISDKKLLEEELKEARENEARVQQELHEECLKRKLLEQQVEELRQQLRHSRETEASLAKMHVELQAKTLHVLEDERKTDSSEHLQCHKENQKLSEQLSLLKEENKALYEEGVRLLNQKDLYVRKYNEMQLRHKDKIRRAKETFIHEVKQRDTKIKQLESELSESKLQVEKGKVLIAQITAENEKLLQERRQLLQKISDQEETPWSSKSMIAALQSRMKVLDEESARLHESQLQLSSHVHASQRALRSILAPSTEDLKSVNFPERQLQSKMLPSPCISFPAQELPDSLSTLKATQDTKPEEGAESQDSSFCLSPSQPSEIGYLNLASPGDTTVSQLQEESQSISSENF